MLTKKYFVMIAKTIKKHQPKHPEAIAKLASELAEDFKIANNRFDYNKFIEACGVIK
ncbi:MAG: hypothetical protein Unbinned5123contig1000_39 [Prokaryotic dsDNA virus sp.]|nr:MAG: hypothetical protein Unbinned5123contig1000_39 [Prokaryotic dsDNA virus sp.]|tara:strand:- start:21564 stop:21734 length:171 start_codon:yes stop_codon:yes gene_type:complete